MLEDNNTNCERLKIIKTIPKLNGGRFLTIKIKRKEYIEVGKGERGKVL